MKAMLTVATVGMGLMFGVGCMENGKDGVPGAAGPAGEDGESYVSYTNALTGDVTTIAVQAGDNSPVEIVINNATGDNSAAGTRREEAAPIVEETEGD